jgi:hypothetical protein
MSWKFTGHNLNTGGRMCIIPMIRFHLGGRCVYILSPYKIFCSKLQFFYHCHKMVTCIYILQLFVSVIVWNSYFQIPHIFGIAHWIVLLFLLPQKFRQYHMLSINMLIFSLSHIRFHGISYLVCRLLVAYTYLTERMWGKWNITW